MTPPLPRSVPMLFIELTGVVRQTAEDLGMDHLDGDRRRADGGR